jgi:hypothetical protein
MSKNNNVNPGQYKVAGRLRPDENDREQDKVKASLLEHELKEARPLPKQPPISDAQQKEEKE